MAFLQFETGAVLDIGSCCYLVRESGPAYSTRASGDRQRKGRMVNLSTLNSERVSAIRRVIETAQSHFSAGAKRQSTIAVFLRMFMQFLDWVDNNGHTDALRPGVTARAAITAYAAHLHEQVRAHKKSLNYVAGIQRELIKFLTEILNDESLGIGLHLLTRNKRGGVGTIPPNENSQSKVLAMCDSLFSSVTPLIVEGKPYPMKLKMPAYLPWHTEGLWAFPSNIWCEPPYERGRRRRKSPARLATYSTC